LKVRKISADVLDTQARSKTPSARELRRLELEAKLESVIRSAQEDTSSAFRIQPDEGEKPSTLRGAFNRVKSRVGANEVNLFKVRDDLIVAQREQRRGRRPSAR
jgi:hypothetical protein